MLWLGISWVMVELEGCSSQDFSEYPHNHYETFALWYLLRVFTKLWPSRGAIVSLCHWSMWDPHFEGARSARKCSPSIGCNFDLLVRLEQPYVFCAHMALVTECQNWKRSINMSALPPRHSYVWSTVVWDRACWSNAVRIF